MGVNSLPKTVTRQRRGCDLNPDPSVQHANHSATEPASMGRKGRGKGRSRRSASAPREIPSNFSAPFAPMSMSIVDLYSAIATKPLTRCVR